MTQKLCRRLEGLEKISAAAAQRVSHASADSVIEEIRGVLRLNDFQPEPNESLAETLARFIGIGVRELRAQMMERAYGHSQSVRAGGF